MGIDSALAPHPPPARLFSLSKLGRGGGTTAAASCWQASQGFYEIFIEPCNHDIAVFLISSLIPAPRMQPHCSLTVGQRGGHSFLWSASFLSCFCASNFYHLQRTALYIFGRHTFSFVTRAAKIRLLSSRHTHASESTSDQMAAKDATAINNAL